MEKLRPIYFSCGPSKKFPGWNSDMFQSEWINRTHIYDFKKHIINCLNKIRILAKIPEDYQLFFVSGSGSGAIWSGFLNFLLPNTTVQVPLSGYFAEAWEKGLKEEFVNFGIKVHSMEYNENFDPNVIDINHDYVVTAVDTANGMRNLHIPDNMKGLVIVDAVTAMFIEDLDWRKLDVVACSMQKILGGDGSLGLLVISPKALERLSFRKPWPIPRVLNINTWKIENLIVGTTMSTPSILALIELDHILNWIKANGDLPFLQSRNAENWKIINEFVVANPKFDYTIDNSSYRARALVCLSLKQWKLNKEISLQEKMDKMKEIADKALELEVYDIRNFYIPSWRFWLGPMQDANDVKLGLERFNSLF